MQIRLLMTYSLLLIHLQPRPWLEERGFGNSDRQAEVVAGWREAPQSTAAAEKGKPAAYPPLPSP